MFKNTDGAVSTDWVVLVVAILGIAVAVLSSIQTGTMNLVNDTATVLSGMEPTLTASLLTETDQNGLEWTYNQNGQLVDKTTGDPLPLLSGTTADGQAVHFNARGEQVTSDGQRLN